MPYVCFLQTGQKTCHDVMGNEIACKGSGQDAEFAAGLPWPQPRFEVRGGTAIDRLTGLTWTLDASPSEFPLDWREALDFVENMNHAGAHGYNDWRLPDRRELRSLISHQTRMPPLPEGHPFMNVFSGWYWTATPSARNADYAWYIHMEGGRTFYGARNQYYLVWPVRDEGNGALCGSGWDSDTAAGGGHAERFVIDEAAVLDRRTNLRWMRSADLLGKPIPWEDALSAVRAFNDAHNSRWRLPNINELESLVDLKRHDPALPADHPFTDTRDVYWSSTTSMFAPDWAWALYLDKGAVGVGRKDYAEFHVWAVSDG